jgi:glycosyltransferase involved in cell wall biosynthesis
MTKKRPRASIGMPVYNGEKYVEKALDSILAQTYQDFELVISDNASTDNTEQICRSYARGDTRIRYYRNARNLGAPKNHNRVFELSTGEYFKWAAHDDVLAPEFLEKCVSVLDKDLSIVLCYSKTTRIDKHGTIVGTYEHKMRISSLKPHERFRDIIDRHNPCFPIFGVMRTSALRMTSPFGNYIGTDRNILAEISLIGRIYEIPEYLFFRRDHPDAYTRRFYEQGSLSSPQAANRYQQQVAWWTASQFSIAELKNFVEYFRSVRRVPLKWRDRLLCYAQINSWFFREGWIYMGIDVENAFLNRSRFGRKLASGANLILRNTVIPIFKRMSG